MDTDASVISYCCAAECHQYMIHDKNQDDSLKTKNSETFHPTSS